ncbi:MAG TPA: 4Fe-4S binding protein [Bacillota bacterium]|nr:4Fe-4S binding protein [Bacillota bacterium]HRS20341.1 4Fe-4S binding protein [Clostridia bacterium]HRU40393.1 4Fe-4S binding protein [Candidatus Diapherotrites archaeon]HQI16271.1 4Fe-4S binding protein [Bacillota bacterium]HQJ37032.1 4Fe-4S binding protein [Bacillota bacterium]
MNRHDIIKASAYFVENSKDNYITKHAAISDKVAGMKIFEEPIFAFGSADDEYFSLLKKPSVIGKHFLLPKEWLPQSETVISFFLPFSEAVRKGNAEDRVWPSEEWLHGRIEGQIMVNSLCLYLKSLLTSAGYDCIIPSLDERFWSITKPESTSSHPGVSFSSNWSERHAAFVCGLGTFGLSKGLISKKGMSGRIGSIITELFLPPDNREYTGIYEYCSMCGTCVKNCPVNAISIEKGKNHNQCSDFLNKISARYKPRYGCGKCQVAVPCESEIPY